MLIATRRVRIGKEEYVRGQILPRTLAKQEEALVRAGSALRLRTRESVPKTTQGKVTGGAEPTRNSKPRPAKRVDGS